MKKQGANNGACLAFLISAPESGIDSIALTYSLLDPIITVIRPLAAFVTAFTAGLVENFTGRSYAESGRTEPDRTCLVDACCDGTDCDPWVHARHHTNAEKLRAASRFAFNELMDDLAILFVIGLLLAGLISALIPQSFFHDHLGSGLWAYLGMLAVSLPMYVCASLSTPVAAALIIKGVSPGAALVLLLAGPATNMATITMVGGLLGARALLIYLGSIVVCTLSMAFLTDALYQALGVSAAAQAGIAAGGMVPEWAELAAAAVLAFLIARAMYRKFVGRALPGSLTSEPDQADAPKGSACCDHESAGGT
ncbi:MAG: permease [Desulfomonile tiedjei]|nr:permease [Desulfomonile tiedjei]